MNRLTAQMRLDAMRVFSQGAFITCFFLLITPVLAFVIPLVTGDISAAAGGALSGMIGGVGFMITLYPFLFEEQGEHRRVNGLIPISRTHQVAGRYLFVLMWLLVLLLDFTVLRVLTWCGMALSVGVDAAGDLGVLLSAVASTLVIMLLDALIMPLLYRYALTKVTQIIGVVIGCCIVFGALLAWGLPKLLPESAMDALGAAMTALAGAADSSPLGTMLVCTLAAAAAYMLSFLLSCRFHLAKEL